MITPVDIYDNVESKVNTEAHPVYCASVREPVPKSFPACQIMALNQYRERGAIDLSFSDIQKRMLFEVQTFSNLPNGAKEEANSVMDYAEAAFNDLYFYCTFRQDTDNSDITVHRVVARFERIIGDADELPETDTD